MITDPIADLLTRIRNGQRAGHKAVHVRKSTMAERVLSVLKSEGFIQEYQTKKVAESAFDVLEVDLKYFTSGEPAITSIDRVSRCGQRRYVRMQDIPQVHCGLGVAILSTSKGVMSDRQARNNRVGGEILAKVS